jgi:hypothetical protein
MGGRQKPLWVDAMNYLRALNLIRPFESNGASLLEPATVKFGTSLASNLTCENWGHFTVDFEDDITAVGDVFCSWATWWRLWIAQQFIDSQSTSVYGTNLFPLIDMALYRDWECRLRYVPRLLYVYRIRLHNPIARISGPWGR